MKENQEFPTEARPPSGAGRAGARRRWQPPELEPENEQLLADLAYIIGWLLKGDGSVYKCRKGRARARTAYVAEFANKDVEALRAANEAMARVLERRPVRIRRYCGWFIARWQCKDFVFWFRGQTLETLRPYIEFSQLTMKKFVQGYADSDGSVDGYKIHIYGAEGHCNILEYARKLCKKLGMRVGDVKPYGEEPGSKVVIDGHTATVKQRRLRFSINARDFQRIVGFNHSERQRKLRSTVKGRRWTPWSAEKRQLALKLREERGWGYKRIAKELGVPTSTVYYWLRGTRSWQEYEARCQP